MPSSDRCLPQIKRALEKAGWFVAAEPHLIYVPGKRNPLLADIHATRGLNTVIIAEVKCFHDNLFNELYTAIGQYLVYRALLREINDTTPLYLAIPSHAYHGIFEIAGRFVVKEVKINLLVVNTEKEEIEQWVEQVS